MSPTDSPQPHDLALRRLCEVVVPIWMRHLSTAQQQADTGVSNLLSQFSRLRSVVLQNPDLPQAADMQTLMDGILTSFLYHDRVSQMSQLLMDDMATLNGVLDPSTHPQALNIDAWLARLEQGYAMAEQRANHSASTDITGAPEAPDSETTYF